MMIAIEEMHKLYIFPKGFIREHIKEIFSTAFISEYRHWVSNLCQRNNESDIGIMWNGRNNFTYIYPEDFKFYNIACDLRDVGESLGRIE